MSTEKMENRIGAIHQTADAVLDDAENAARMPSCPPRMYLYEVMTCHDGVVVSTNCCTM